jgi:hypothetical protein
MDWHPVIESMIAVNQRPATILETVPHGVTCDDGIMRGMIRGGG